MRVRKGTLKMKQKHVFDSHNNYIHGADYTNHKSNRSSPQNLENLHVQIP